MKAIRLHQRGGVEQLRYEEAPVPQPEADEALVRVCATGITPTELTWDETYSKPDGSPRLPAIPGHEVSGIVEALGSRAGGVRPGDAVYALTPFPHDGAAAEYVTVPAAALAPKPKTIDYVHAAAVPLSALTAWQFLFDHARLKQGDRVLIHAAAGGVGTFAVQLAKWRGIHVIGTASAKNAPFLRELGADEVIDYRAAPFEDRVQGVDAVLDSLGGDTRQRSWKILRPGGILVSIVAPIPVDEAAAHQARGKFFIVEPHRGQLTEIANLIDAGKLKTIVANVFPLEQARAAFELGAGGHTRGKIVIQVRAESQKGDVFAASRSRTGDPQP